MARMSELLALRKVCKGYSRGERRAQVLVDASLEIDAREIVAVVGEREAGKTTLLRIAAGIEAPRCGGGVAGRPEHRSILH